MTTASVIRQIESLFAGGSVAGMTDRELIESFNAARDATGEAAFAAIVSRHGPMVLKICAQILGDQYDAEDAVSGRVPRPGTQSTVAWRS